MNNFQLMFDSEHPNLEAFKAFICTSLECYRLHEVYEVDDIIKRACTCSSKEPSDPNTIIEIHAAWLKTACLEIIEGLSRQHANKQRFNIAIEAVCDIKNPEAQSFLANITRTLRQFRLAGTYEMKEIVAEAYSRGIKQIESDIDIQKPLPWMRTTCLNVIRELRRKQDQADNPKLDSEGHTSSDEAWSRLILNEDLKALHQALKHLSPEERELLHERYINNRSWQDIGDSLPNSAEHRLNSNAIRQRGFRALQKLRSYYDQIRPEVKSMDDSGDLESTLD
jgi:RNA polymerase sigma factor (sigma-70 family)